MKIIKKQKSKSKIAAAITAIVFLVGGAYLLVAFNNHYPPFERKENTKITGQGVSLERSDTEKQKTKEVQNNPDSKLENNQTDTPNAPTDKTTSGKLLVNVLLSNAAIINNTVRSGGVVTDIVEEGGECTYVFTSASSTITKKSGTLVNSTSTTCEAVSFSASELPVNGVWKVVLTYNSKNATGTSNTKEFTK